MCRLSDPRLTAVGVAVSEDGWVHGPAPYRGLITSRSRGSPFRDESRSTGAGRYAFKGHVRVIGLG